MQLGKSLLFCVGLGFLVVIQGGLAEASELASNLREQVSNHFSLDKYSESIQGEVYFEKRYTKVVHEECESGVCPHSEPYWTVLIRVGNVSYIVNKRYGLGRSRAPQEVELGGVALREGMMIQLDGVVYSYASDSFVISEVVKVSLLRELGWACHSLGGERSIFARVWRDPLEVESSRYRLRVQEIRNRRVRTLAELNQMSVSLNDQWLVFEGETRDSQGLGVRLEIQQSQQEFRDVPSQLTLLRSVKVDSVRGDDFTEVFQMSCSRTRS